MSVRKHLNNYVADFNGARALRSALVRANSADEVRAIIEAHLAETG
jgi:tRNA-dihydrouridine synthase